VPSDEELRMRRERMEEELRAQVVNAEREYHAAVTEYKHRLRIHAEGEDSPGAREAIRQATRTHQVAVDKYGAALREFNRLVIQSDPFDPA
jgi:hypothetical protein